MIDSKNLKKVKTITQEFFEKMGVKPEIEVKFQEDVVSVDLDMEDPQVFIGNRGQTLNEIQRLLSIILRRKINNKFFINLDINDYKKKKLGYLQETAASAADEVVLNKKEKILPPMSAYERRIIHLEISKKPNVISESIGEEPERRIIIKPKP